MYQEIVREKLLVLVKDLAMDGLSGYFRLPVRESEAPNYSALVKHPADLDSIANRIMYEVFSLSLSLSLSLSYPSSRQFWQVLSCCEERRGK